VPVWSQEPVDPDWSVEVVSVLVVVLVVVVAGPTGGAPPLPVPLVSHIGLADWSHELVVPD
jgi:hypothetical protein